MGKRRGQRVKNRGKKSRDDQVNGESKLCIEVRGDHSKRISRPNRSRDVWAKNPDGTDLVIERKNALYEKFYRAQNILPDDQWDSFMDALRRDLPQSFRFVGCRHEAEVLMNVMKERYFSKFNDLRIDGKPVEPPKQWPWYPDGLAYQLSTPRQVLRKNPLFNNIHNFLVTETELGNISRQEAVSMIPPLLLQVKSDSYVLDMCAAPGSKTAQLIEMLHSENDQQHVPSGFVLANDENNKRCYLLVHQSLKRINSPCCLIVNNDASIMSYPRILSGNDMWKYLQFDQILCDVPCSGDGTLRKNVGIWKTWGPYHGYNMHRLQTRIAKRGLEMLAVGGLMAYSTCSLNPAENEAVIAYLLNFAKGAVELVDVSDKLKGLIRSHGLKTWKLMDKEGNFYDEFSSIEEAKRRYFPETIFPPSASDTEAMHLERCVRVLPHFQDTGAFFIALLKKTRDLSDVKKSAKDGIEKPLSFDDLSRFAMSTSGDEPPRKRKFKGYKEDAFVFLSGDDPWWEAIRGYFDVSADFKYTQLLSRGNEDKTKKRNLYFVNDVVKRIIEANDDRLKLINAGIRLFSRIDLKEEQTQIRLTQEGLDILLPYIRKRVIPVTRDEMVRVLTRPRSTLGFADLSDDVRKECEALSEGSLVLKCSHNERAVAICAWRGKTCLIAYLAKETIVHILRMLSYDTTEIENEMVNAKRQKKGKATEQKINDDDDEEDKAVDKEVVDEMNNS